MRSTNLLLPLLLLLLPIILGDPYSSQCDSVWDFCMITDDTETEGTEGDEKEIVTYSISSEVKFYDTKVNR